MTHIDRGQVSSTAAEVYDSFFVPALFTQWTGIVLDAADVGAGHRVLDVGCGTGVLARDASSRVGPHGHVAAVDPNDGMLDVARRAVGGIDWRVGVAEALPFPDRSFDRTVSQFALMFFVDPGAAIVEMSRVTRRRGHVALAVWDRLENNAGYARLAALIEQLFGGDAADAIRAPFHLGHPHALAELGATGLAEPTVTAHRGVASFDSLEAWLHTEIRGWTLADAIDDEGFARLLAAAREQLADLSTDGARIRFEVSALIVGGRPIVADDHRSSGDTAGPAQRRDQGELARSEDSNPQPSDP